jgi:hypothetical protein
MKGMVRLDSDATADGKGMAIGKLGFDVADVGSGGRDSKGAVKPGMKSATNLLIPFAFYMMS